MQHEGYHHHGKDPEGGPYQPLSFCFEGYMRTHSHPDLFMAIQEEVGRCSIQQI